MVRAEIGADEQPDWPVVAGSLGATIAVLSGLIFLIWVGRGVTGLDPKAEALMFAPGQLVALGSLADALPGGRPAEADAPAEDEASAPASGDPEPTPNASTESPIDRDPDDLSDEATTPSPAPTTAGSRTKPASSHDAGAAASPSAARLPPSPLPSVLQSGQGGGLPTGTPQGFSDRLVDGDPWATDVLRALSKAPVGTFGGDLPSGTFRFKLEVCPDGRIGRVQRIASGSTITEDGADRVVLAISRLELERPPADVRAAMAGRCTKLDYTFAWTASGVQ